MRKGWGFTTAHRGQEMTEEQRKEIENFIQHEDKIMTIQQAQAIAQAILENHDMLKELTGKRKPIIEVTGMAVAMAEPTTPDEENKATKAVKEYARMTIGHSL